MSQDYFKPLKDFILYEVNKEGDVRKRTSKRPLTPQKTKTGDRFHLHDSGHILTIARSKLQYCYENGCSPYELRGRVMSNGKLMSVAEHCERLRKLNLERIENYNCNAENDVVAYYEYNIRFLSLLYKMISQTLTIEEAQELSSLIESSTRKALVRYYRDKKEYRKEEIDDVVKELFYGTFLKHCPANIDCYIYEIVKRKFSKSYE